MKKIALVAFNGEVMCFVHVLLNALDMNEKGYDVKLVVEGAAVKVVNELNNDSHPFSKMYREVCEKGLIDCVCQACAAKLGALDGVKEQGLPLNNEMLGHPSLASFMEAGYEIITF
ncbi:DsrE/DsrF-like family protein [Malonomonas rubra DSM 5091]|uniref:DsrE/DsrF-like family protein n=1 Tax=Malonomonas rubra DSM 5091 TaxID=1122189 RepID=A0A1M6N0J2_MALRU|nr:DsrE family protein [Malonomonas rubra]SHJ89269.1 DsrE/DsrF-like family protein [Malonomonas rubra DSM 5091]